jgi:hypothetical protein
MCLQAYPKGLGISLYLLQPDQMSSKRAKFQMYLHGQPIACLCAQPSAWNIESRHSVKLVKAGPIQCVHRDDERVDRTIQAFAPQYKVEEGVLLRR